MTQICFFSHFVSNHGRECDNSNLASTLQTVHITGMCMHSKHAKTLRQYWVLLLTKIVNGFKKCVLQASPLIFSLKIHVLQTYKCFESVALESYCIHFSHGLFFFAFFVINTSVGHFICDVCTLSVPFMEINTF